MCQKCFDKEYEQFFSMQKYEDIKYTLERKLLEPDGLFLLNTINNDLIFYQYKCRNCDIVWYLLIPEEYEDGFLLQQKGYDKFCDEFLKFKNRYNWARMILSWIFYLILLTIFIFLPIGC